jgi:plastocyanin
MSERFDDPGPIRRASATDGTGGPVATIKPRASKVVAALMASVAMLLALSPTAVSSAPADVHVSIVYRAYQPSTTTVNVGETVTWTNTALIQHTVTAVGGAFDSGRLNPQESFSVTFTKPGEYLYACMIHPTMKGTVIVRSAQVQPGPPQSVQAHLSSRHGPHGSETVVHVLAPRPGARALLEAYKGSRWLRVAQTRLSSHGTATLSASSADRRLRVLVLGQPGERTLISRPLRAPG